MQNKELKQIFFEKLKVRLLELGLSKATASNLVLFLRLVEVKEKTVIFSCTHPFYLEHIILPQKKEIESLIQNCWGVGFTFHIKDNSEEKKASPISETKALTLFDFPSEKEVEIPLTVQTTPIKKESDKKFHETEMSFSNFVRCESNEAALTACEAVAQNPGKLSNPLFIYGQTGLGKTHLLQSVGNEVLKNRRSAKIIYITSNDYVNDVIHRGIKSGRMEEVRRKYNDCDALLVDDIQFLENKDACQIEFFHTFNELYQRKKQIVITSDKFPKDIPNIEERLKSRFLQGLLVDIEPPGFEDRVAIIDTKCQQLGLKLKEDEIFYLATHAKTNVREIEGILKDIFSICKLKSGPGMIDSINSILKKRFPVSLNHSKIDLGAIKNAVAFHFQIKLSDLVGKNRQKRFVLARHVAMFLAKQLLDTQMRDIAESFGSRDHTTVLHALTKIDQMMQLEPVLKSEILQIKTHLENTATQNKSL